MTDRADGAAGALGLWVGAPDEEALRASVEHGEQQVPANVVGSVLSQFEYDDEFTWPASFAEHVIRCNRRFWPQAGTTFRDWYTRPGSLGDIGSLSLQLQAIADKTLPWFLAAKAPGSALYHHAEHLQVGDITGLRAVASKAMMSTAFDHPAGTSSFGPGPMDYSLQTDVVVALGMADDWIHAPAFYLGTDTSHALLASDLPADDIVAEIRLPFPRVLVYFPAVSTDEIVDDPEDAGDPEFTGLCAFVLFAKPGGVGIEDYYQVMSLVERADGFQGAGVTVASIEASKIASAVINAACLLTWGSWEDPQQPWPLPTAPAAFRKAIRKSAFKRSVLNGTFDGARVIDLGTVRAKSNELGGSHASPKTHMRRGHWRRVRVGIDGGAVTGEAAVEGETYSRQPRWIPPSLVNPGAGTAVSPRTYRTKPR